MYPTLPRGVRIRLWLLIAYLLVPIDLVPGYADDTIIVAIALRSVIRHADPQAIQRHWPGQRRPDHDPAPHRHDQLTQRPENAL